MKKRTLKEIANFFDCAAVREHNIGNLNGCTQLFDLAMPITKGKSKGKNKGSFGGAFHGYIDPVFVDNTGSQEGVIVYPDGWEGTEGNQDRLNIWVCPKCGCETPTRGSTKGKAVCAECGHVIHEADE